MRLEDVCHYLDLHDNFQLNKFGIDDPLPYLRDGV